MQPSLLTRLRWRLEELRDAQDAKVIVGVLALAALVGGGFLAARTVARASDVASPPTARVVTLRQTVPLQGRVLTQLQLRKFIARGRTMMETIHSPNGVRVVTRPVSHYRTVYRKRLVTVNGKTRTVLQPLTQTQTLTDTQLVTITHGVTNTVTVKQPVTVVVTNTVVSTETRTLPVTVTVTVTLPVSTP